LPFDGGPYIFALSPLDACRRLKRNKLQNKLQVLTRHGPSNIMMASFGAKKEIPVEANSP